MRRQAQRQMPMPIRLLRWMRSKLSASTARCQQALALGGPVARRSGAVALARDQHHWQPGVAVARRPPSGSVWPEGACSVCATGATGAYRLTRLRLWKAARSITSQLPRREANTFRSRRSRRARQEIGHQAVGRNGAGRRDVVGGDVVAQHQQRMGRVLAEQAAGVQRREGRTAQDGGVRPPGKARARGRRQRMPVGWPAPPGSRARNRRRPGRRPDRPGFPRPWARCRAAGPARRRRRRPAARRPGRARRRRPAHRRSQVAATPGTPAPDPDARGRGSSGCPTGWPRPDLASLRGPGHAVGQRTGIADAGGAAVAHDVEADGGQIVHQPGAAQVAGGGGRARPQRGLDPGRGGQSARAPCAPAGRDQQRRVRGVGAAGDRGDGHGIGGQAVRRAGARWPLAASAAGTPASGSRSCGRRGPAAWLAMPSSAMVMVRV